MKAKFILQATLGIISEVAYSIVIMAAAFTIMGLFYIWLL